MEARNRMPCRTKHWARATIHGVGDLSDSKGWRSRVFWLVVLASCLTVLVFNSAAMARNYNDHPIMTRVHSVFVERFPPFSFCPLGLMASKHTFSRFDIAEDDLVFLNDFFLDSHTIHFEAASSTSENALDRYNRLQQKLSWLNLNLTDLLQVLSSDLTLSAAFTDGGHHLESLEIQPFITDRGLCFRSIRPFQPVAREGVYPTFLELELPSLRQQLPGGLALQYTHALLFLGNDSHSFHPTMSSIIHDGRRNILQLQETHIFIKDMPYRRCSDHMDVEAIYNCFDNATLARAGCKYIRSLLHPYQPVCHRFFHFPDEAADPALGDCMSKHVSPHPPCERVMFESAVSRLDQESPNSTIIFIQYRFPIAVVIEEQATYSWSVFLSNIGGIMSLLCGASVLSLAQVLYFSVLTFTEKMRLYRQNRQSVPLQKHESYCLSDLMTAPATLVITA